RCYQFGPSNGLGPFFDRAAQEGPIVLPTGALIDTDTGSVLSAQGAPIAVTTDLVAQPGAPIVRVLLARSWSIADVRIRGIAAVAFVAIDDITVNGLMDASADVETSGPGASACGASGDGGEGQGFFTRQPMQTSGGYPAFLWQSNGCGG